MARTDETHRPRIVAGVDGSQQSKQALRWAAKLADAYGARLDVVAASHYPIAIGWAAMSDWDPADDAKLCLDATVDEVLAGHRPPEMRVAVREGNPAVVLIDEGRDALMVVVGSRGHGGFAGLLLGSVSAAVAEHASCPVLVVHGSHVPA